MQYGLGGKSVEIRPMVYTTLRRLNELHSSLCQPGGRAVGAGVPFWPLQVPRLVPAAQHFWCVGQTSGHGQWSSHSELSGPQEGPWEEHREHQTRHENRGKRAPQEAEEAEGRRSRTDMWKGKEAAVGQWGLRRTQLQRQDQLLAEG